MVEPDRYDARSYWDRRLDRDWTLQGVGLKGLSLAWNRWLYRVRSSVFGRAVGWMDLDPAGARVLDVGPGVGFYTQRWLERGADVTGVDIADSAVRQLRERFPRARFERLDIAEPDPDLPGDYDVVDAFDVLFHIVDDSRYRQAFANVAGLLRPGGYFLFTDNCASRRTQPMKHYVRRSRVETEDAIRAAGLEVVTIRPAFVLMNTPFDGPEWQRRLFGRLRPVMQHPVGGELLGAVLFLPELLATRVVRGGPTTKIVLCRKPPARGA